MQNVLNSHLRKYAKDCYDIDVRIDATDYELSAPSLMMMGLALSGEAGEACNVIKKIVRDGESPELWNKLTKELVDILIYLVQVLAITKVDFDAAWNAKHVELHQRVDQGQLRSYQSLHRGLTGSVVE